MHLQTGIISFVLGSVLAFSFGVWPESLTLLVVLMGIDYITGVTAAIRGGSGLNSQTGFWGLAKKGLSLLVILLTHRVDVFLGMDMVMGGAIAFYLVNELLSVIENCGRLGIPLPDSLSRIVEILRDRAK
ncbi:MAG: holin [Cohnella sp.]|nr:holin [Cohnella sp.]